MQEGRIVKGGGPGSGMAHVEVVREIAYHTGASLLSYGCNVEIVN